MQEVTPNSVSEIMNPPDVYTDMHNLAIARAHTVLERPTIDGVRSSVAYSTPTHSLYLTHGGWVLEIKQPRARTLPSNLGGGGCYIREGYNSKQ